MYWTTTRSSIAVDVHFVWVITDSSQPASALATMSVCSRFKMCMCVCVYVCMCACVHVCMCVFVRLQAKTELLEMQAEKAVPTGAHT